MGKLAERMNMLEKDCFKTLMAFLPEGTFSAMGTFTGATDAEIVPGLDTKAVMNLAVNTLAFCEEASEALDKIEVLEEKLDEVLARQAKLEKLFTVLVGQSKNGFDELDTRLDGLEEAVRELVDDKTLPKRTTKKVEKEKEE